MRLVFAFALVLGLLVGILLAPMIDANYLNVAEYCERRGYPSSSMEVVLNPSGGLETVDVTCFDGTDSITVSLERERIIGF